MSKEQTNETPQAEETQFATMQIRGDIKNILNEKLANSYAKQTESLFNDCLKKYNKFNEDELSISVSVASIKKTAYENTAREIRQKLNL